ncbi:YopJ-like peptidase. Cysteine peptidase. MEROPS family C55 [Chitinasiproducens palmae]|uniref:YopJ-like peptidase. Cysteine peptidase. MEROPS family C55 n=2 Tax=Chitinasiproducens palmae TaxID=1770053 RepID=A0A1H2PNL8_9BURK|nr:YopJ-like peptidase. Cysteine peptidase. MEROPS family C55 [Chitinasiproducens palmae]
MQPCGAIAVDLFEAPLQELKFAMSGLPLRGVADPPRAASLEPAAAPDPSFLAAKIEEIERSLNDGSWTEMDFAEVDEALMPGLVAMANDKKTGLDLCYLPAPKDLCDSLDAFWRDGLESKRYVVNSGNSATHFVALDVAVVDGKVSVALFEPTTFDHTTPCLLAALIKVAVKRTALPHAKVVSVALDIQRSNAECGMFSLALAKKLLKERDQILALHKANLAGTLGDRLRASDADRFLPPVFFKHSQGTVRLDSYIECDPTEHGRVVNKKGQTLSERQWATLEEVGGRRLSKSIHLKRLVEYKALAERLDAMPGARAAAPQRWSVPSHEALRTDDGAARRG